MTLPVLPEFGAGRATGSAQKLATAADLTQEG